MTKRDTFLFDLSRALLNAQSIAEIEALAIPVIAAAVHPKAMCRLVVSGHGSEATGLSPHAFPRQLAVPLWDESQRIGLLEIVLPDEPDVESAIWDEQLLKDASVLLATAVSRGQRLEAERKHLLTEATQLKFDIVAMLSHEMRTPLASIKGYSSALRLDEVVWAHDSRAEFLKAIEEESDRLNQLVTSILDAAVIEAGELRIVHEPILLPNLARRLVDKISLQTKHHRFIISFPETFPILMADAERIDQVLTNLLDNAVKYSPDGGLIVIRGEMQGREALISVADEGIGIAPEHLNKLFERFFRARSDERPAVSGTGLGLPISDAIIRAHGGRIWAESVLGRGTTFWFTLPIGDEAELESVEEPE